MKRVDDASLASRVVRSFIFLLAFLLDCSSAFVAQPQRPVTRPGRSLTTTTLMGIKGFRSFLQTQFPSSFVAVPAAGATSDFDHVLIDLNQLLHVVLRKGRSEGHALTLLMKELDACLRLATPTKSVVLAMDGAPSAAKLATQRKRRFSTVVKTDFRVQQINRLLKGPSKSKRTRPQLLNRKKRRALAETRTLCITPATDFMFAAEQALLYWVWQRLSSRNNRLSENNVKVFISPSTVAGEGEVKLLEWIYNKSRKGETVAILGGDSDLVLEGLVIPTTSTHNVFVMLPEGNKSYLCVSVWEMTRSLHRFLPHVSTDNIMRARTDLALVFIMNGNDYIPKLRGSGGFNKLFHAYLRIHRAWDKAGKPDDAYLVDPDTLEFNLDFCIDFFSRLVAIAPTNLWSRSRPGADEATDRTSSLQQLNHFVDAGYLPQPIEFQVITDEDNDEDYNNNVDESEDSSQNEEESSLEDDNNDEGSEEEEKQFLVRLALGEPGTEDFAAYELWQPKGFSMKTARHKLAAMAISDLTGEDSDGEESDEDDGLTGQGYEWEVRLAVEGKVDTYLYGLVWTLMTYQDGICADYGFNYGKRLSPTAKEIVQFFKDAKRDGKNVGLRELSPGPFTTPVSAGVSCLAALPSTVKHWVPEPYRSIDSETVESLYASCMSKDDNVFDMKGFEKLLHDLLGPDADTWGGDQAEEHDGRRIIMGDHYWTVVSKVPRPLKSPFDPPLPFSQRLSKLRPNNRIKVSRTMATTKPRPRSAWTGEEVQHAHKEGFVNKDEKEVFHADSGSFVRQFKSIKDVLYAKAYKEWQQNKHRKGRRKGKIELKVNKDQTPPHLGQRNGVDIAERLRTFKLHPPPAEVLMTTDGVTGMACLKQLHDAGLVGAMHWETESPSMTEYASFDREGHESVTLRVAKGTRQRERTYVQDREVQATSRQIMKQHLASLAVQDILGSSATWSDLSFKQIRYLLSERPPVVE